MEQNEAISSLIKKYFYLTDKSKNDFDWFLNNQEHAEEFKLIAEQPDKRLFLDYPVEANEIFDDSWQRFRSNYRKFVEVERLTYKNYIDNKTNNNIKISKALFEYYCQKDFSVFEDFKSKHIPNYEGFKNHMIRFIFTDKDPNKYFINKMYFSNDGKFVLYCINRENNKKVYLRKKIHNKTFKNALKAYNIHIKITEFLNSNYLGNRLKISDLKVCLSLNYSDWLLCSTKNSWTSCLSLENSLGYWAGLASLVCDKNRIMIFLTDGKEKEFMGIKSYNMIRRAWALLLQNNNKETFILCNKIYPNKDKCFDLEKLNIFPEGIKYIYSRDCINQELFSKHYLPIIWHKGRKGVNFTSGIYEDSLTKEFTNNKEFMCYSTRSDEYGINPYTLVSEKDIYGFEGKEEETISFDHHAYCCTMNNVREVS
ncbi:MAG: hypothetical protein LBF97_05925 [Elusimicrobiota bacterium]|jgi:hypothetical protein|nr:hypothetical protein [Elusimicrobiota bacterium]